MQSCSEDQSGHRTDRPKGVPQEQVVYSRLFQSCLVSSCQFLSNVFADSKTLGLGSWSQERMLNLFRLVVFWEECAFNRSDDAGIEDKQDFL